LLRKATCLGYKCCMHGGNTIPYIIYCSDFCLINSLHWRNIPTFPIQMFHNKVHWTEKQTRTKKCLIFKIKLKKKMSPTEPVHQKRKNYNFISPPNLFSTLVNDKGWGSRFQFNQTQKGNQGTYSNTHSLPPKTEVMNMFKSPKHTQTFTLYVQRQKWTCSKSKTFTGAGTISQIKIWKVEKLSFDELILHYFKTSRMAV